MTDLDKIKTSNHPVNNSVYNPRKVKGVIGLDTETNKDGKVTIISNGLGHNSLITSFDDLLEFLFRHVHLSNYCFFFNLSYDTNAIIKYLPDNSLFELMDYNNTLYVKRNGKDIRYYRISIIMNKCLTITQLRVDDKLSEDGKQIFKAVRSVKFYDIYQFYQLGNLETTYNQVFVCNAKGFKCSHNFKKKNFNKKYYNKPSCTNCMYYSRIRDKCFKKLIDASKKTFEYNKITDEDITYCIEDSKACQRLAKHFVNVCNKITPVRNYYSSASLGKAVLKKHMKQPYLFQKTPLQKYALKSYNGGRFECIKRGYFDNAYTYDINSAYPYSLKNLYGLMGALSYSKDYKPEAKHSFFYADVFIDDRFKISPLKFFMDTKNLLMYPIGAFTKVYLSKSEYETLIKYDVKVKIIKAYHIIGDLDDKPFEFIQELYDQRQKFKQEKNPLQLPLKLAMNSMYGVMIQTIPKSIRQKEWDEEELINFNNQLETVCPSCLSTNFIEHGNIFIYQCQNCYNEFNNPIEVLKTKEYQAGGFYNPVWASEITAQIRCKLFEDSIDYQDNVIMYSTDSITFDKKVNHLDMHETRLGAYDKTDRLKGVVLGSGIYSLGDKKKFRGFGKEDVLEIVLNNKTKSIYEFTKKSPMKLKESKKDLNKFNVFLNKEKRLMLNFDRKRIWSRELNTFNDVLDGEIDSKPIII